MAAKKIVIKGQDYHSVQAAITAALGESNPAEAAVWAFLENLDEKPLPFLNKSTLRERKGDEISLFFPRGASRDKRLWNGIAGTIHGVWPPEIPEEPEYDITLELGSRFDEPEQHYFLYTMMLSWLRQDLIFTEDRIQLTLEDVFQFLWIAIFKNRLTASYEQGIYKSYQYFEDNSDRIRGAIDIPRHIRLNLGLSNGKIASKYRENTTDNFLNHLLIHTYLELKKRFPGMVSRMIEGDAHTRSILRTLMSQAPSYAKYDVRTVMSKLRRPISHPFFLDYEQLRNLCFQILSYVGVSFFGEDRSENETKCMLFYTPDLWEAFVEDRILSRTGISWEAQGQAPSSILPEMRPDFVLSRAEGDNWAILDAKYKEKWAYFPAIDTYIKDDVKQCLVYKALFRTEYTGTIYPIAQTNSSGEYPRHRSISGRDPDPKGNFLGFGVAIPPIGSMDFEKWREQMEIQAEKSAGDIRTILPPRHESEIA